MTTISRRQFLRGSGATAVALSSPACVAWFAKWYGDRKAWFDFGRKREEIELSAKGTGNVHFEGLVKEVYDPNHEAHLAAHREELVLHWDDASQYLIDSMREAHLWHAEMASIGLPYDPETFSGERYDSNGLSIVTGIENA